MSDIRALAGRIMTRVLPGVLKRTDPLGGAAPVVFDSPHSGSDYPDDFEHRIERAYLRQTEDAFIDELFEAAPSTGAVLLCALFPRSYVDPNRAPDDLDPDLIDGEWPHRLNPGEKSRLGVGLIPTREPGGSVYDRKLTVAEARRRIERFYWPYHRELEQALDDVYLCAGSVWHVNCHSMPAVSTSVAPEGPGMRRPDFCLGTRDGTTCDRDFVHAVRDCLAALGYAVTIDDPFKGVELVRRYSEPARGRHSLQIEVNRGLYMDEARLERSAGFAELKRNLDTLVRHICDYARDRTGTREDIWRLVGE